MESREKGQKKVGAEKSRAYGARLQVTGQGDRRECQM